jgi:hypothetical protein
LSSLIADAVQPLADCRRCRRDRQEFETFWNNDWAAVVKGAFVVNDAGQAVPR